MSSAKQLAANRANALLSSGPTSSQGKAKISHNALKTGLTGRTVLLPSDDVAAFQAHIERIFTLHAPESDEEKRLTQSLADSLWRLDRIPSLEAGIYAIGHRELAAQFADEEDESVRKAMIEAQIFLSCRRDLNNLSIQQHPSFEKTPSREGGFNKTLERQKTRCALRADASMLIPAIDPPFATTGE